jgi:hypothetical protein
LVREALRLQELASLVMEAAAVAERERGTSWEEIGSALGVGKSRAHERFAKAVSAAHEAVSQQGDDSPAPTPRAVLEDRWDSVAKHMQMRATKQHLQAAADGLTQPASYPAEGSDGEQSLLSSESGAGGDRCLRTYSALAHNFFGAHMPVTLYQERRAVQQTDEAADAGADPKAAVKACLGSIWSSATRAPSTQLPDYPAFAELVDAHWMHCEQLDSPGILFIDAPIRSSRTIEQRLATLERKLAMLEVHDEVNTSRDR